MFFNNKVQSHLPFAEGDFIPGVQDVMTEYGKNGVLIRLYYPTDLKGTITDYSEQWIPWILKSHYLCGLAKVLMVWESVISFAFWFYSGRIYIPAVYGGTPKQKDKMKCIVLSHGLGATRYFYSTICADLASRGFLVAVLEHRENSACSTFYFENEEDVRKKKESLICYEKIDFGPNHLQARQKQVKFRSEECKKVADLLYAINNGNVPKNILEDLPNTFNVKLDAFKNCLDLSDLTIMGHSFGGATALLTLQNDSRYSQAILLDPWMFPIKDEMSIFETLSKPILFINTQTFHIESNIKAMDKVLSKENVSERKMFTILHTTHESQCDSPFVSGYWLNWFMKKLNPLTAFRINNHLILRFLNKHIAFPKDIKDSENFLNSESHNFTEGLTKAWA